MIVLETRSNIHAIGRHAYLKSVYTILPSPTLELDAQYAENARQTIPRSKAHGHNQPGLISWPCRIGSSDLFATVDIS